MDRLVVAERLRRDGYVVYSWEPSPGTVEPDIVAKKESVLYNIYLKKDDAKYEKQQAYAKKHGAEVLFILN